MGRDAEYVPRATMRISKCLRYEKAAGVVDNPAAQSKYVSLDLTAFLVVPAGLNQ